MGPDCAKLGYRMGTPAAMGFGSNINASHWWVDNAGFCPSPYLVHSWWGCWIKYGWLLTMTILCPINGSNSFQERKNCQIKSFQERKVFFERVSEKSVGDIRILSRDHSSQKMTLSALLSLKISLKGRERRSRTLTFLSRLEWRICG